MASLVDSSRVYVLKTKLHNLKVKENKGHKGLFKTFQMMALFLRKNYS
jgi:hypothetical protein